VALVPMSLLPSLFSPVHSRLQGGARVIRSSLFVSFRLEDYRSCPFAVPFSSLFDRLAAGRRRIWQSQVGTAFDSFVSPFCIDGTEEARAVKIVERVG
jgi:hypothetical protein